MTRPPLLDLASHDWPWVTPPELAVYLRCHPRSLIRMIDAGALRGSYKVGRNWRIPIATARAAFHEEAQRSA